MFDSLPPGIAPLLCEFLNAWCRKHERKAASNLGKLVFWRDGVLRPLSLIAECNDTADTYVELSERFLASQNSVEEALATLVKIRDAIGASSISESLDCVIYHEEYGKTVIRHRIEDILEYHKQDIYVGSAYQLQDREVDSEYIIEKKGRRNQLIDNAISSVNAIRIINLELSKLTRMMY